MDGWLGRASPSDRGMYVHTYHDVNKACSVVPSGSGSMDMVLFSVEVDRVLW